MANLNLEITLKDGKFVSTNIEVDMLTDTYVKGMGWECYIFDNGKISCKASKKYNGEKVSVRYVIWPHGYARLTYKSHLSPPITIKNGFVVPRGVCVKDGVIGLSDGEIKDRYAFYRTDTLHNTLTKMGINKIKKQNPNMQYYVKNGVYPDRKYTMNIITDGICKRVLFSKGNTKFLESEYPDAGYFETEEFVQVSGATYVLSIYEREDLTEKKTYKILYSLDDIRDLESKVNL